jgi:hypothetical protein
MWNKILSDLLQTEIVIVHDYETEKKKIGDLYKKFKANSQIPVNLWRNIQECPYFNYYLSSEEKKTYRKHRKSIKIGGNMGVNINKDNSILERERLRFGNFLDQISLKTESGILPVLRIFEDHDENIMACIYYGFYMRLAVNFYQSKYVIKLSKIDTVYKNSYIEYNKSSPSLTIYQNLLINNRFICSKYNMMDFI